METITKRLENLPETVRPNDLARAFEVTRRTLERWTRDGRIPRPFRIGGRTLWDREQLIRHVRAITERQSA